LGRLWCAGFPEAAIELGTTAKPVTIVLPYYENLDFLRHQLRHWSEFPLSVRPHFSAIIVDDGSPRQPAELVLRDESAPFPVRLFRIDVDVRWNWLAARNVGAHHAPEGWMVCTDMDHVIPHGTAEALVYGIHDPDGIYIFERREHTGCAIHPHPNSWFYTRRTYWRIGGYDERFSGYYGTDGIYRRRCALTAPVRIMDVALERHEFVGDSSTVDYLRKQPEDAKARQILAKLPRNAKPRVLSFPYHEVSLCSTS